MSRAYLPMTAIVFWTGIFLFCPGPRLKAQPCPEEIPRDGSFQQALDRLESHWKAGCRAPVVDLAAHLADRATREHGPRSLELSDALYWQAWGSFWLAQRGPAEIELAERSLNLRLDRAAPGKVADSHLALGGLLSAKNLNDLKAQRALHHYEQARKLWLAEPERFRPQLADLMTWYTELIEDWGSTGRQTIGDLPWVRQLTEPTTVGGRLVQQMLLNLNIEEVIGPKLREDPSLALVIYGAGVAESVAKSGRAYADCLNTLGVTLGNRRLHPESLLVYQQALEARLQAHPPDHPQVARGHHNLGEALLFTGRLDEARTHLERAFELRLAQGGERYRGVASTTLNMLAKLYLYTGDLRRSVTRYREALDRIVGSYGHSKHYVDALMGLAEAHTLLGEKDKAEQQYRTVLRHLDDASGDGATILERQHLNAQARLGNLLVQTDRPAEGLALLRRAKAAQERQLPAWLDDYAETLAGLARHAESTGNLDQAADLRRQVVERLRQYNPDDRTTYHPRWIDALLDVTQIELANGSYSAADDSLTRTEHFLAAADRTAAISARSRAALYRSRVLAQEGRPHDALHKAVEASLLYSQHLLPAYRVLSETSALRLAQQHQSESLSTVLTALAELETPDTSAVGAAWQAVMANRASVLEEMVDRRRRLSLSADSELQDLLAQHNRARVGLARLQIRALSGDIDGEAGRAAYYRRKVQEAETQLLTQASLKGFEVDISTDLPEPAALSSSLPANTAILSFVRYSPQEKGLERYGVFIIHDQAPGPTFVALGDAVGIDQAVEHWRSTISEDDGSLSQAERNLRVSGQALKKLIWRPIREILPTDLRKVFLIPEGSLHLIPLAALPGSSDHRYLIDEGFAFHRLVSERDLDRMALVSDQAPGCGLLAVGGPSFNAVPGEPGRGPADPLPHLETGSSLARLADLVETGRRTWTGLWRDACDGDTLTFPRLDGAQAEAQRISELYRRTTQDSVELMVGKAASERRFKELAQGHEVLHIATHGFTDLRCGANELGTAEPTDSAEMLPGLAFTGANRRVATPPSDDGILTTEEIVSLDLSGTRWVVLSACETAMGRVADGEGVLGLARGFRVAGAKTLILSLWRVKDQSTAYWMESLYRSRFEDKADTVNAVRLASLDILNQLREQNLPTHPVLWAGFISVGDWR